MRFDPRPLSLATLIWFCLAAGPTTAPTSQPTTAPAATINWSEAAKHIGQRVTVTGPVKGTHVVGDRVVLNVGQDYPAKDRFTIMMPFNAAAGSADDQFVGKTATVTGTVKLYKKTPEIVTTKASDVVLAK